MGGERIIAVSLNYLSDEWIKALFHAFLLTESWQEGSFIKLESQDSLVLFLASIWLKYFYIVLEYFTLIRFIFLASPFKLLIETVQGGFLCFFQLCLFWGSGKGKGRTSEKREETRILRKHTPSPFFSFFKNNKVGRCMMLLFLFFCSEIFLRRITLGQTFFIQWDVLPLDIVISHLFRARLPFPTGRSIARNCK